MTDTTPKSTMVRLPSSKQVKMITSLAWQLRPFYVAQKWTPLRSSIISMIEKSTMDDCNRLIKMMLITLKQKQEQNAQKYWYPMDYQLLRPHWRDSILRIAKYLFPEESFDDLDSNDYEQWRELKNRVERKELKHSYRIIADDFENDTRAAEIEEERWGKNKPHYHEMIAGIDWFEAVQGIDY